MPHSAQTESWDYQSADTKPTTHCYHNYPAMMIPQIARRLIEEYGRGATSLFDPYCGTGTSLVEASIKGINAHGCDLNPMARLIARTKTLAIELQTLDLYLKEFNDYLFSLQFGLRKLNLVPPDFNNIEFWFKPETIRKLTAVKSFVSGIEDDRIKNFFLVSFSETVRDSSLSRNSEFKLYRMPEKKREAFAPDVFSIMTSKLARNRAGLKNYLSAVKDKSFKVQIYDFNSSEAMEKLEEDSVDIIVTSPPYGDSKTTVAYGQFSRLSNQWLGIENAAQIDNLLMGGRSLPIRQTGIGLIDDAVAKIKSSDEKRAREVFSFYHDYANSIRNVAAALKPRGYACYVVGNRRVKNTVLMTDEITRSLFESQGFAHHATFIRRIPHKRMPSKNSPTNVTGQTAETMNNEYIVIMRKQ